MLSQGNNVGRSVSYSLLPSELVSSVEVNKSSQAKLQDGGTTGTVNIITRKPLEFSKPFTAEGSIGLVRSDQAKSNDPQYSALFNYKNDEGTFGVMVQGFSQKRELRREAQEIPGGFFKIGANDPVARTNPDLIGVNVPGLLGSTLFEQTRERKGGLVSLQFKPSDSLTLGLNGFSSELKANNYNRNFMMFGNSFAKSQAPDPGYVVKDGVLTNATYRGVPGTDYAVYDMIYRESKAKSSYVTFDADWQINDSLTAKFQAEQHQGHRRNAAPVHRRSHPGQRRRRQLGHPRQWLADRLERRRRHLAQRRDQLRHLGQPAGHRRRQGEVGHARLQPVLQRWRRAELDRLRPAFRRPQARSTVAGRRNAG